MVKFYPSVAQNIYIVFVLFTYIAEGSKSKENCDICKEIDKNFQEGLKNTAKSNFGGGNTKWEESRLGSFATSETRLVEIMENLCSSQSKECHVFLEKYEELVEKYWFSIYAKKKNVDLFLWLCIENIKVCCPKNTYGTSCKSCPGGTERPCNDNGDCDGAGTRSGKGTCSCNAGYHGDLCDSCSDGYFEEVKNDTHTICKACHASCKSTCWEPGPKGCDECKEGWTQTEDDGCIDINECEAATSPCTDNQYCSNNEGSYYCASCHSACIGCTHYGADKCKACAEGYNMEETECKDIDECQSETNLCPGENRKCVNTHGSYSCSCMDGYIEKDSECIVKPPDPPKTSKSEKSRKDKKKSNQKSFMSKLQSFIFTPNLLSYLLALVIFAIIGNLFKGHIVIILLLSVLLAQYLYWFSSKFDKSKH